MGGASGQLTGPDLAAGVALADLQEGAPLVGHAHGEAVVLVKRGDTVHALGAACTHYGGPLGDGLVVGDTLRCPWHHACFDLRTGEAVGAPALSPVPCFEVERRGALVVVGARRPLPVRTAPPVAPSSVVIVGAGAAGAAAVETLRREGYGGPLTLVGDEPPGPVDRPNLSKDYLAGTAPEEWIPLRDADFYRQLGVELVLGDPAVALDVGARRVTLASGRALPYGALLLATGAEPRRLPIPGADAPHVLTLRSLADSRAIIARARAGARAVVLGASFIGLEVAASLRARGVEVDVVAPEALPLERALGPAVGRELRRRHEDKGVRFHLGRTPREIRAGEVLLDDGRALAGDFVVMGVGVAARTRLAEAAGLAVDNGVVVDEHLQAAPGVYAAGDVARFPYAASGERVRIEHWVVAERMGQVAAHNILGQRRPFRDVPFFWSVHYDYALGLVGHAAGWDAAEVKGDLAAADAAVVYRRRGQVVAVATVGRDQLSLAVEAAMEQGDGAALERLLG
jgi:NADPH-dependent 2,4-dienoyl-CoA reductase/sulfur reductase-like enzyme/nitrite reductase/ring-hydroxylating ferredoxin subunit